MNKDGTHTEGPKCKILHLSDGIHRLYVSRKEGGRGLSNFKVCIDASTQGSED